MAHHNDLIGHNTSPDRNKPNPSPNRPHAAEPTRKALVTRESTMDSSLVSLSGLLVGNHIFDIPVFQRNYAWERKNLEDLWEDIYYMDPSKKHYFGTVLLKDSGETAQAALDTLKRFDVIDGQQRLTTVSILLREVISQLKRISDQQLQGEVAALEKRYLRDGEHYKINPLGDDGQFFHHVIIDGNEFLSKDTVTHSQRRLADAKAFFRERLLDEEEQQPSDYQAFLVQLKRKIDDLQLIQYQVNSDADAIRIFQTVNDRGRPLSGLEKTKSFLMHTSYLGIEDEGQVAGRLEELNGHFSRIYRHFEAASGTRHMERLRMSEDDVHRYHFINYISSGNTSSRPLESLKDRIREMLREDQDECAEYALMYAKDLERAFYAVREIADAYRGDEEGRTLSKIFMLERMGNIFPLLIASWLRFSKKPSRMEKILKLLEAFIVRVYVVGGWRSDAGGSRFNRMARRIHQGELDYAGLIGELRSINREYQSDGGFRRSFDWEDFYTRFNSRDIKYLLTEYETHLRKKSDLPLALSTREKILSSEYEVEHIWAQSPSSEMSEDEEVEHSRNVHRLGNLTIASESWNKSMGNKPFERKRWRSKDRPSYSNSSLLVQKELAELTTWDVEEISKRELRIVEFALQRWSV